MRWLVCLLRGGHQPVRLALSTTRLVCRRCGIELDSLGAPLSRSARSDAARSTITRGSLNRHR